MKKRYPHPHLVKSHRNFTVGEIAELFGMHKTSVRRWIKEGLPLIDSNRPILVLGRDLIEFLRNRRERRKRHCKADEMYCVRCRMPKHPAGDMAEYSPVTDKYGNLAAICPSCDSIMNKRINVVSLHEIWGMIDITLPEDVRRIIERNNLTVNSNFDGER